MRRAVLTLLALLLVPAGSIEAQQGLTYDDVSEALRNLAVDESMVAPVNDLVLERHGVTIRLAQGSIALTTPVAGRVAAAVFSGEGSLHMEPPLPEERQSLVRYREEPTVDEPIRSMVLLFSPETLAELQGALTFGPGEAPRDAGREIEEALKYLSVDSDDYLHTYVMANLLNPEENGFFYAHVAENRGDPLLFLVNPYVDEAVSLSKKADESREKMWEVMTQYSAPGADTPGPERGALARLDEYQITVEVTEDADFAATASFDVWAEAGTPTWFPVSLYSELEVAEVTAEDGSPLPFHESEELGDVWIGVPGGLSETEPTRVTMRYAGEILEWFDVINTGPGVAVIDADAFLIRARSSIGWYPRPLTRQRATFDITFRTPADFRVASVGRKVSDTVAGDVRTSRWEGTGVRNAGFNIGRFVERPIGGASGIEITMQVDDGFHNQLSRDLSSSRIPGVSVRVVLPGQYRDRAAAVGRDVFQAFNFFQRVFGASPVSEFYATEIPGAHGEAFPGMIHLWWSNFMFIDETGGAAALRAHEVAHQWWGIAVDYASYRDRWLSEGLSEFAARWYLQVEGGQEENFYELLEASAELVRDARRPGVLRLGNRAASRRDPENYVAMVYEKGAWVLHMLRHMMMDFDTRSEARFESMMRDFYSRHAGGSASTADFQAVVEEHMGEPMDWFFTQWFDRTELPKYRFEYDVSESASGTYEAAIEVRQEEVADDFKMWVPVEIDYGSLGREYRRILVEGPTTETTLTGLRAEPERIRFNAFMAVLTEDVDGDEWEFESRR